MGQWLTKRSCGSCIKTNVIDSDTANVRHSRNVWLLDKTHFLPEQRNVVIFTDCPMEIRSVEFDPK